MNVLDRIDRFFFARSSASGLGAMRVAWAAIALLFFLMQWQDVSLFYSDQGFIPRLYLSLVARHEWYVSILTLVGSPAGVFALYLLLLLSLFLCMIGVLPRLTTILSFLLMCSFHERDMLVLGGGDTMLRLLGFILSISPGIRALSLSRAFEQWKEWKMTRKLLKPVTMYAWTYRMILWQALVVYLISLWWKLMGTTWQAGTAVEIALHHPFFSRWPHVMETFLPLMPFVTHATLVFEAAWIVMLFPRQWRAIPLKLALLACGAAFHLSILVLMDAGSFSLVMFALYCGLLQEEDIAWIKARLNARKKRIVVLYDGDCGLCLRSMFTLSLTDWLKRLTWKNFRDASVQKKEAKELKLPAMKREIHVLIGKNIYRGFYAFRALSWQVPPLWPLAPFLYIPGVPAVGTRIYAQISARRAVCRHGECTL